VIRSRNFLSRLASDIFIHLAIKEIATIISLNFRSPTPPFALPAAMVLNSTGTSPDNVAPVLSQGFSVFILNNWQSRKPCLFKAVASAKPPSQREVEVRKLLGAFRYNLEE
jgi:hypothetical protein